MLQNQQVKPVTGIVLAGGRGLRMGGVNKGLVDYQGRLLFEYAVENLKPHTTAILVNTNTQQATYKQCGFSVIDDGEFPYEGPLAGIYAGLCAVQTPYIAVAACDQLALPPEVYHRLIVQANQRDAAFAVDSRDIHPTCAVISINCAASIREYLQKGQRKLGQWMRENAVAVAFDDVNFANINDTTSGK